MSYYAKKILGGRWGIYHDSKLLATIGCDKTCKEIISLLEKSKRNSIKIKDESQINNLRKAS